MRKNSASYIAEHEKMRKWEGDSEKIIKKAAGKGNYKFVLKCHHGSLAPSFGAVGLPKEIR